MLLSFRAVTRQKLSIPQNTSKLIALTHTVSQSASVHGRPGRKRQLITILHDYFTIYPSVRFFFF